MFGCGRRGRTGVALIGWKRERVPFERQSFGLESCTSVLATSVPLESDLEINMAYFEKLFMAEDMSPSSTSSRLTLADNFSFSLSLPYPCRLSDPSVSSRPLFSDLPPVDLDMCGGGSLILSRSYRSSPRLPGLDVLSLRRCLSFDRYFGDSSMTSPSLKRRLLLLLG